jgi:uncharacterized damage-inducible protein DinB
MCSLDEVLSTTMDHYAELMRHNAWANHAVLEAFRNAEAVLDATAYDGETLRRRAMHLAETERGFLAVMRRETARPARSQETLDALVALCDETGAGLVDVTLALQEADLGREYYVPWWQRAFPFHTLIAQVLAHSAQHRAELAWELARAGVSTGEIDFIVWKAAGEPAPGGRTAPA